MKEGMNWINIKDKDPESGIEVLLFNEKWIDKDFNPNGVRIGFKDDLTLWTSASYSSYKDHYFTRVANEDDVSFSLWLAQDQFPTHWKPINNPNNETTIDAILDDLYNEIKHGDQEHMDWLKNKIEEFKQKSTN